ncbi:MULTISPECIES: transporter substrate-binding domain-containing protein [unclassified Enterobacter cloacae complex]|uniref:transporter substrate-binding domain-containing protein n=1 Tax=unclassified Enterobacter cloacae complex TaxID=2757714 RepID=UPI003AAF977D
MKRWVHFKLLLILLPLYACAEPLSDKSLSLELYPDTIIQRFYKQSLKVGVYRPDYPPFDIVINGEYLDGINADILRTIRNNSDIHFSVTLFDNAVAAFDALAEGSIDAITTTGPVTETKKSRYSYLPAISTNKIVEIAPAENKLDTKDYETIATVDRFISDEFIKERYPEAKINRYDSVLNALASVALHKNDIYVGDAISAGYFYNNSVFNTLHVSRQLNTLTRQKEKYTSQYVTLI